MRHRIAAFFGEAPLLFIGVVLGIAVLFRVGLDAVRPAPAEAEAKAAPPTAVVHEAPRAREAPRGAEETAPAAPSPASAPAAGRTNTRTGALSGAPGDARRSTRAAPHRRKPRTHGRR